MREKYHYWISCENHKKNFKQRDKIGLNVESHLFFSQNCGKEQNLCKLNETCPMSNKFIVEKDFKSND